MRTLYDSTLQANLLRDDSDKLRAINHHDEFPEIEANDARQAALQYLRNMAGHFDIDAGEFENAGQRLSFLDPEPRGSEFRLRDDKRQFDTATFAFNQTYLNLPVWESGVTVTLKEAPWRALASTNTSRSGIDARMPSDAAIEMFRKLFATGERIDQPQRGSWQPAAVSRGDAEVIRSQRAGRGAVKAATSAQNEEAGAAMAGMLGDFESATRATLAERRYGMNGLIRGRFYVYRHDAAERLDPRTDGAPKPEVGKAPAGKPGAQGDGHSHDGDDQPLCGTPPRFPGPIPPVADSIRDGRWYVVAELVFRRPLADGTRMNWRALVEVETGSILYLRALASGITGYVFEHDPVTSSGDATRTPEKSAAILDPSRVSRTLNNLDAPVAMTQSLSGARTFITDVTAPAVTGPTRPSGSNFDIYSSRSNDFAAVNAYYHTDRFFALVENLGFSLSTYFNGTTFPIETDHRGYGTTINAQCVGDGDGIDYHHYALADLGDTTNPIGIATDWRVVLHELGGHGILHDHVNSPNFGFSHSAGDSLAVILNDPASAWHSGAAIDRFVLSPFIVAIPRYSDRGIAEQSIASITVTSGGSGYSSVPTVTVSGGGGTGGSAYVPSGGVSGGQVTTVYVRRPGRNFTSAPTLTFSGGGGSGAAATANLGTWGWGAGMDQGGYLSEEILSTTHFRIYRSLGGDSSELVRREFAARATVYLILRAVGSLTPMSNPSTPALFLNALVAADAGDWTSEGLAGGAYNKVLRWAFEKQNLNGGARPAVDVYINDGRGGEYPYQPVHWANGSVWNRLSPDDMEGHQNAAVGVTNYAYCKVRNRGTSPATNVIVRGYHCLPSAGVTWPTDMQPMTTASIMVGTIAADNTEERIVGPFSWVPNANAWGHDCMMMIASATGDPSNVDLLSAGETYADSRLVPHDNNVGQRNVVLTGALDGLADIKASLQGKGFWIGNPERKAAIVTATIALPSALERAGWKFGFRELPEGGFRMKPGERRLITFDIEAGATIDRDAMRSDRDRDIVVTATANGAIIGGMVYRLDPDLAAPKDQAKGGKDSKLCREKAQALLDCLDMPKAKVKCVKVRKVAVDLELDSDDCCD